MPKNPKKDEMQRFLFGSVEDAPTPLQETAYMAGRLVQCTLPHSDPGNIPIWTRNSEDFSLTIRPYYDKWEKRFVYPYGPIPRLLLYWVVTEAVRRKSPKIELGKNLSEAMKVIGLNPRVGGGALSQRTTFREQSTFLFRSTISYEDHGRFVQRWLDMAVAPEGNMWWEPEGKNDDGVWQGYIVLGPRFYHSCLMGPVPLDYATLRNLKGSSLALDLYAWLTYQSWCALRQDAPIRFFWGTLAAQFGADYSRERDFRQKGVACIAKIMTEFPALRVIHDDEAITVFPAMPHVKPTRIIRLPPAKTP